MSFLGELLIFTMSKKDYTVGDWYSRMERREVLSMNQRVERIKRIMKARQDKLRNPANRLLSDEKKKMQKAQAYTVPLEAWLPDLTTEEI